MFVWLELWIGVLKSVLEHAKIDDALTHDGLADSDGCFRVPFDFEQHLCPVLQSSVQESR